MYSYPIIFLLLFSNMVYSQVREYRIHDRGMLHETVFNTGTIGRPWQYGDQGNRTDVPLMEWPSRSKTIIDGIEYSGQHNIIGAGIYVTANVEGSPGRENRIYAFCGGCGTELPELPLDRWSFPISMEEIENFPILEDGSLNLDYDPDEAEEIIIAKWATPTGIQVTRTSRAWSYTDFDDMIIYEYEFEYTGDTDGRTETIEMTTTLVDVLITFNYGFAQSMLGIQRNFGEWKYDSYTRGDSKNFYDPDYWLGFNMVMRTGAADQETQYLAAHPEPNKDFFREFSETGLNGGGLLSPQAVGYCILYYDTDKLAIVDPDNPDRNESEKKKYLKKDDSGNYFELDENGRVLQPWNLRWFTDNARSSKLYDRVTNINERWLTIWDPDYIQIHGTPSDFGYIPPSGKGWLGRSNFLLSDAYNGAGVCSGFGPYTLELGEKIEFAVAEVVGYGATAGKMLLGGQVNTLFAPAPTWNRKVILDGEVMTEHYLDDYGYPDYVNSDVITVSQVAHKAFEAYLGRTIPYDAEGLGPAEGIMWPEDNPSPSTNNDKYKIPVTAPAPALAIENTDKATVMITWNQEAEDFTHPRLVGPLVKYNLYRSNAGMGPWTLLASKDVGDVNSDNLYEYDDDDETFKIGEPKYYAVTSVDDKNNESGKTNIKLHNKNIASVTEFGEVYAVPNPFVGKSGFAGAGQDEAIGFYGLPKECTIKIYSYSGQLVETIEHNEDVFSTAWFQVTRNRQDIASGIYIYIVETPEGQRTTGKLIVIK